MGRNPSRTKRAILYCAAILLTAAFAGTTYRWFADRRDLAATPPPGQFVDVGGHRLHIWCTGSGC